MKRTFCMMLSLCLLALSLPAIQAEEIDLAPNLSQGDGIPAGASLDGELALDIDGDLALDLGGTDDTQDVGANDSQDADAGDSQDAGNDEGNDGQISDEVSMGGDEASDAPSEDDIDVEPQEGDAEFEGDPLILDEEEMFVDGLTLEDGLITPNASAESVLVDEEEAFYTLDSSRNSDELFATYAMRMFYSGSSRSLRTNATNHCRETLSDQCKIMYDAVKPEILKVAEGSRSSTLFPVLLSKILGKTEFYAKTDLNLNLAPPADGETISSEVKTQLASAYFGLYDKSLQEIVDTVPQALWLDCTYELYWLDRYDRGVNVSRTGAYVQYDKDVGDYLVFVADDASITFRFPVLESYALVEDGLVNKYKVDTTLIDSAKQASANAKAIVRKYEDYPDYVKLYAYAKEICDLVEYDEDAADDAWMDANPQVQDPWKLIWVFDDDPNTNVVCEGYAQAFKYLCELSSFSGNIGCWHVTGYVPGGAHSWNIVRMENGKNYVVDVTWMDGNWDNASGTMADWISNDIGVLFLCGGTGSVSDIYDVFVRGFNTSTERRYMPSTLNVYPASALTLNDSNYILKGWQAIDGSAYYFDDDGHYVTGMQLIDNHSYEFDNKGRLTKQQLTGKQIIGGKEFYFNSDGSLHTNHTPVADPAVTADSTHDGLTAGSHCSVCGAVIVPQETVHWWNNPTYTWASNCSTATAKRVCANDASHVETRTVRTTAVVAQQPTCTEKGKTTYTAVFPNAAFETQTRTVADIPAVGHNWNSPTYTWAADNSSVTARRVCATDPSHVETETVKTTTAVAQQATCTAKGKTTYTAKFSNSGFSDQSKTLENIPVKGHSWGKPTYTWTGDNSSVTAKRVCANDASHVETETVKTTSVVAQRATCTARGRTTFTAKFSSGAFATQSKTVEDIPARGHSWNSPTYTWADDNGSVTAKRVCASDASHVETETVKTTSVVVVAPTCTDMGRSTYTAKFSNGGFVTQDRTVDVPAKGHTPVTDPAVAPTYTATGLTEGSHCADCGVVLVAQKTVDKLDCTFHMKKSASKKVNVGVPIQIVVDGQKIRSCRTSNKKVATVSKKGWVSTLKAGKATITITLKNGRKLTLKLTVVDPYAPKSIRIVQGSKATLKVGKKLALKVKLNPSNARTSLTWKSSNKKVAKVNSDGEVVAKKKGTATITVTTGNDKKAKIKITVKP